MTNLRAIILAAAIAAAGLAPVGISGRAMAATVEELNASSNQALQTLYRLNPAAAALSRTAVAVLIFPNVVKAGFVFGGAFGEGELQQGAKIDGYYNSITASWGLQAGAESYSYAVFLMTPKALEYIHATHGWEIGVGPTVVLVDEGMAKNLSTSTLKGDAYAFIFGQQGLMAGIGIEGTKITQIKH
jgi:lipid-binding SYLF domain-containing protein